MYRKGNTGMLGITGKYCCKRKKEGQANLGKKMFLCDITSGKYRDMLSFRVTLPYRNMFFSYRVKWFYVEVILRRLCFCRKIIGKRELLFIKRRKHDID